MLFHPKFVWLHGGSNNISKIAASLYRAPMSPLARAPEVQTLREVGWLKPVVGWIKLNTESASRGNSP